MKNTIVYLALCFGCLLCSDLYAQGYTIIVHPSTSISSFSKNDISKLFLKKKTTWPSGAKVLPVDLLAASSVRIRFSKDIHGKDVSSIAAYWQQQIFSGRSVPPPEEASDKAVIAFVQEHPGAIGYVSGGVVSGIVKVLTPTE